MTRKPTDSPYRGGSWSKAEFIAYERQQKIKLMLIGGICIAVGLAALVVFFWRGGF